MSQVKATDKGYYGSKVRIPGEEFSLTERSHFSSKWMEAIGWTPGDDPLDHDGDGKKGGSKAKKAKAPADAATNDAAMTDEDKILKAMELSGRDDITTVEEAEAILAAGNKDI